MTEENAKEANTGTSLTTEQVVHIRKIVQEELAKWEKNQLHEQRFGVPYTPKEHK